MLLELAKFGRPLADRASADSDFLIDPQTYNYLNASFVKNGEPFQLDEAPVLH